MSGLSYARFYPFGLRGQRAMIDRIQAQKEYRKKQADLIKVG